jgi:hypothetical protein
MGLVRTDVSGVSLLVTANVVHSSSILSNLKMDVTYFSETSILTRITQPHIPEDDVVHE